MSELSDVFDAMRAVEREHRQDQLHRNTERVKALGIPVVAYNNGLHLLVAGRFDFWPSTERFQDRKTRQYGSGWNKFIDSLREFYGKPLGEKDPQ